MIPHMMARHLIISAVVDTENDDALVHVKEYQKREVEGHARKRGKR